MPRDSSWNTAVVFGRLQQLEGVGIVEREFGNIQRIAVFFFAPAVNVFHRPVNDGERAQTEKVELDQADGFDIVLVELGDNTAARLLHSTAG